MGNLLLDSKVNADYLSTFLTTSALWTIFICAQMLILLSVFG